MINFIICDDENEFLLQIKEIITKVMFPTHIDFKIHTFNRYDDKFLNCVKTDIPNKLYILDIEVNNKSGIEMSKEIRKNDWESVIILLTAHYELSDMAVNSRILLLDFISKFDSYSEKITECIKLCVDKITSKNRLSVKINRAIHNINYKDILYLTYDLYNRKTIIETINKKYEVCSTLKSLCEKLQGNFVKTHKACIVNMDNVISVSYKNSEIEFINNKKINLLSRNYKKVVKNYEYSRDK